LNARDSFEKGVLPYPGTPTTVTFYIADAVFVGVFERSRVRLIYYCVRPPFAVVAVRFSRRIIKITENRTGAARQHGETIRREFLHADFGPVYSPATGSSNIPAETCRRRCRFDLIRLIVFICTRDRIEGQRIIRSTRFACAV